jgi:hypothetical protein
MTPLHLKVAPAFISPAAGAMQVLIFIFVLYLIRLTDYQA